jgi:hypothetical protein
MKLTKFIKVVALGVVVILAAACDDDSSSVSAMRTGWEYGLCGTEYCKGEVTITKQNTAFTASPRPGSLTSPLLVSEVTLASEWRALEREIDTLPDEDLVIGCAGCLDEGVEWIEFERPAGSTVSIVFSCGVTVSGAESIQSRLRAIRDRLATTVGMGGNCMRPLRP